MRIPRAAPCAPAAVREDHRRVQKDREVLQQLLLLLHHFGQLVLVAGGALWWEKGCVQGEWEETRSVSTSCKAQGLSESAESSSPASTTPSMRMSGPVGVPEPELVGQGSGATVVGSSRSGGQSRAAGCCGWPPGRGFAPCSRFRRRRRG